MNVLLPATFCPDPALRRNAHSRALKKPSQRSDPRTSSASLLKRSDNSRSRSGNGADLVRQGQLLRVSNLFLDGCELPRITQKDRLKWNILLKLGQLPAEEVVRELTHLLSAIVPQR